MEKHLLERVRKLLENVNLVYVATADKEGVPHLAAEEGMLFLDENHVFFRAWFCFKTLDNLRDNPKVSLAVLDSTTREGYQLLGVMERIERGAILNGFFPEQEGKRTHLPQAEHQLSIRVQAISHLTSGPHSDEPIQ